MLLCNVAFGQSTEADAICGTPEIPERSLAECSRPFYSTPEESLATGHFKIHYTLFGVDAATHEYAAEIALHAESSYVVQCMQMGFLPPPSDSICGGDPRWDIYLKGISPAGFTVRDDSIAGENRWVSHVVVRANLSDEQARREVVAHEFHHMIQFGYSKNDFLGSAAWFSENTAEWIVPFVFPSANQKVLNRINSGPGPLRSPWWSITSNNSGDFVNYAYGGALWPTFLGEWLGDSGVTRQIYDRFRETPVRATFADMEFVLSSHYQKTLAGSLEHYAIWRNFTGSCPDSTTSGCTGSRRDNYHFSDANRLGYLTTQSVAIYPFTFDSVAIGSGGCSFTSLKSGKHNALVTFQGDSAGTWSVSVLGINTPGQSQVYTLPLDENDSGWISIPWSVADSFVVVPVRVDTLTSPLSYHLSVYDDSVSHGSAVHSITASSGGHGVITPDDTVSVSYGSDQTFTMQPDTGYHVDSVLADGVNIGAESAYTFSYVVADHSIRVVFSNQHTITASTSGPGSISPSGTQTVLFGDSIRFVTSTGPGGELDSVVVDGVRVDSTAGYTFRGITSDHTIRAFFFPDSFTITASADSNGAIVPSGAIRVGRESNRSFTIVPDSGFEVHAVVVDGIPVGDDTVYQFMNIGANHTINAIFRVAPLVMETSVMPGWNLVSLPFNVADARKVTVFPSAISAAYAFTSNGGYAIEDTMRSARGYWLKFSQPEDIAVVGFPHEQDTIDVLAGWNLIGPLSEPVVVSSIEQIPPDIIETPFYLYNGVYVAADSLLPAKAYWVKLNSEGRLVPGSNFGSRRPPQPSIKK
ncbi:MAG: InlB B-repeat-containing protein [Bacteroidota bacterium]